MIVIVQQQCVSADVDTSVDEIPLDLSGLASGEHPLVGSVDGSSKKAVDTPKHDITLILIVKKYPQYFCFPEDCINGGKNDTINTNENTTCAFDRIDV